MNSTPKVFISATSGDLRSVRAKVKEAMMTLNCLPVEQSHFGPDCRTVREMLEARIGECDALIHVVGLLYGAEPKERPAEEPRRSYTQMEYHVARDLGIRVYTFICPEDFPYDPGEPEAPELRALQKAHR